jgi:hypothetical protein
MALTRVLVDLVFSNWAGMSSARFRCDRILLNRSRHSLIGIFAPTRCLSQPLKIRLSADGFVRSSSPEGICNLFTILLNLHIFLSMRIKLLQSTATLNAQPLPLERRMGEIHIHDAILGTPLSWSKSPDVNPHTNVASRNSVTTRATACSGSHIRGVRDRRGLHLTMSRAMQAVSFS